MEDIRNIAIIAHVDHGKTTLVDSMLRQSGIFRQNQVVKDRVMDSGDIERERGITITSKNTAVYYNDTKINIIDTPGHADFGGEVERVLKMASGVLLLVDAYEGPMPQTKFVLKKALELGLKVIVVINKIDRKDARIDDVIDEVLDLFIELGASDDQLDAPFLFASARDGYCGYSALEPAQNMKDLFDAIIKYIPKPKGDVDANPKLLISTIDYSEFLGRIGIGKIESGTISQKQNIVVVNKAYPDRHVKSKISGLFEFDGLERVEVESSTAGNIVAVSGIEGIEIGDTITVEGEEPLEFVKISEPTISMTFSVNDSPFAGREGDYVTSRQLRSRLMKEIETNVSMKVKETDTTDSFIVYGRGELHISVLIETMRREGYEFQVSKPQVIYREIDGRKCEPIERVMIDVDQAYIGPVMDKLGQRRGELRNMTESRGGYSRLEFDIPARGLIGYRQEFMTDTRGEGILNTEFKAYEPYKGDIPKRQMGSLIAFETTTSTSYGLYQAQERGNLFIGPGVEVYEGMIVGENPKGLDIEVNVGKEKQKTNMRAAGTDDALRLVPPIVMSLEEALEFIEDDELIEVTPKSIRLRKKILSNQKRYKSKK
ncbi:translational GTPase TypA [uncultured Ezakiella sp.]|uniref:translational GTPase TypA n=1 Tax=uncultured Ezakiella sp. TaxID=1637529 RepID=UPI0025FEAD94|nr:translational GTPase TypA [uncultured Ezakiella sp.]